MIDPENLLAELSKMGINGSVERCMTDAESEDGFTVKVQDRSLQLTASAPSQILTFKVI